jgi:hypothetical protein
VLAVAQLAHLIVDEPGDAQRLDRARVVLHAVVDLGGLVFLFSSSRVPGVARALLLVATFQLARLRPELSPYGYVWLLTGWMVMCAALSTRALHGDAEGDLERYLGASRAAGSPARPSRSRRGP